MANPDIFEPFERLIQIKIGDQPCLVPENNTILRCLQYLDMENISDAELCWNGECLDCMVWIKTETAEKAVIACRTRIDEGMQIVRISEKISIDRFR